MLQGAAKIVDITKKEDFAPLESALAPNQRISTETGAEFQNPLPISTIRPVILEGRLLREGVDQATATENIVQVNDPQTHSLAA